MTAFTDIGGNDRDDLMHLIFINIFFSLYVSENLLSIFWSLCHSVFQCFPCSATKVNFEAHFRYMLFWGGLFDAVSVS